MKRPSDEVSSEDERPVSRRSEIGDESKQRILNAAESLFIELGVSATSFARIERKAGISRGSIPWHFTNKRGLLIAILERAMLLASSDFSDLNNRSGVRQAFSRLRVRLHQPQAALLAALMGDSLQAKSETHTRFRQFHIDHRNEFADLLRRADDVQLPEGVDEDQLAAILFGAVIGVHLQSRVAPDLVDLDETIDGLAQLIDQVLAS